MGKYSYSIFNSDFVRIQRRLLVNHLRTSTAGQNVWWTIMLVFDKSNETTSTSRIGQIDTAMIMY